MSSIVVKTPCKISELVECLKCANKDTYLISGGTDLLVKMRNNPLLEGVIIDLKGIKELNYIKVDNNSIKIGANSTFTEIRENPIINKYAKALKQAALNVGSTQIRNVATLAGNVANCAPAADAIPALIALSAEIKLINGQGKIITNGIEKVLKTLKKDQAIIEIVIPIKKNYISAFSKIGSRSTVTISKLNLAACVSFNNEIEAVIISAGSLGPKAIRLKSCEEMLLHRVPSMNLLEEFKKSLACEVEATIPGRASLPYKREAIVGLAEQVFYMLFPKVGGDKIE